MGEIAPGKVNSQNASFASTKQSPLSIAFWSAGFVDTSSYKIEQNVAEREQIVDFIGRQQDGISVVTVPNDYGSFEVSNKLWGANPKKYAQGTPLLALKYRCLEKRMSSPLILVVKGSTRSVLHKKELTPVI